MNLSRQIIKTLKEMLGEMPSEETIINSIKSRLVDFRIEGVDVDKVIVNVEGSISVRFIDEEGTNMIVIFYIDKYGIPMALVSDASSNNIIEIDFSPLAPSQIDSGIARFIDLGNLIWMNKSTLLTIFNAGNLYTEPNTTVAPNKSYDAFGNIINVPVESIDIKIENGVLVVESKVARGKFSVRLPIVRSKKREGLSADQRKLLINASYGVKSGSVIKYRHVAK